MPQSLSKRLRAAARVAASSAGLVALACGWAFAATPSSGTLSPATPLLTFSDGPFTGPNPPTTGPDSNGPGGTLVPNSCSAFLLTGSIPAGYTGLHPKEVAT